MPDAQQKSQEARTEAVVHRNLQWAGRNMKGHVIRDANFYDCDLSEANLDDAQLWTSVFSFCLVCV